MKTTKLIAFLFLLAFVSCKKETTTITIENKTDLERSFETITLSKKQLHLNEKEEIENFTLNDYQSKTQMVQYIDIDNDGKKDGILFQPKVKPNSKAVYTLVNNENKTDNELVCYARFVPERTDDYAWENDKIAFRVYGPTAQKMIENKVAGGTLSSGVDCWLKRVEYPIINKWYKKYADKTGTYHKDTGEGLDNYHVGTSRGCGGIAIKNKTDYAISKNYIAYKTIMTGPIRTQFSLQYAAWNNAGKPIEESRIITLDKGNNLSKFDIKLEGTNQVSIGLTLHKNDGIITKNKEKGWISYWENLDDSELGTAVLLTQPNNLLGFDTYISKTDDVKNQFVQAKVKNKHIVYYAGFGWEKSKQFQNKEQWNTYLTNFSKRLKSPLLVHVN